MNNQHNLSQVIEVLKKLNYTDEQIAEFCNDISQQGFANLYQEAMNVFTEEDLVAIEACASDEEANQKIKELYTLRTGKNPDEEMQKFLSTFSEGFLKEYENKQNNPQSPSSDEPQQ